MDLIKVEDELYLSDFKEVPFVGEKYIENDGFGVLKEALNNREEFLSRIENIQYRDNLGKFILEDIDRNNLIEEDKTIIVNGYGGIQNTYKNRILLKNNPFSIIESIIIAGYLSNSNHGIICIREDYKYEIELYINAIKYLEDKNILGKKILTSDYNFKLDILPISKDIIDEEDSSLLAYIEGQRGCPTERKLGLYNKPSLILDVETVLDFKLLEKSIDKTIVSIIGDGDNDGLYYVDYGMSLKDIVSNFIDLNILKGIYLGGPLGMAVKKDDLDIEFNCEGFKKIGLKSTPREIAILSNDRNILHLNRHFARYLVEKSCGKCTPCREGTKRLEEVYSKIIDETGDIVDLERLKDLSETMKYASFCRFGELAGNIFLETIKNFTDDYREFIDFDIEDVFKEEEDEA